MQDYLEKPKKKKRREKEEQVLKAKPTRNFKIIDDDINLNDLQPNEENEILADLLDLEGPVIAHDVIPVEKPKPKTAGLFIKDKWVTLDFSENDDSNASIKDNDETKKSLFKKRGDKSDVKTLEQEQDEDSDLDTIPRKRVISKEEDLSPTRRISKNKADKEIDLDDLPRRKTIKQEQEKNEDFSPVRRRTKSSDDDFDSIPRKKTIKKEPESQERRKKTLKDEDSDLDIPRSKNTSKAPKEQSPKKDKSPTRKKESAEEFIDETKVRVRKMTKEEEMKKAKNEELKAKYADWGRGLTQKKEKEEKIKDFLYESEKPLARYAGDKDLENLLKSQEREDDPMLQYIKQNRPEEEFEKIGKKPPTQKYRGPPPPPNRYNILPGSKWDGVDRSNGFEKKYYESIQARKAFEQEAYKWSTEDM